MKKITTQKLFYFLFVLCVSLFNLSTSAQTSITESYNKYTEPFEEVAYTHLNKSTYIKGETIGFTSYVLNKKSKKPSEITTNLYCVITNEDNEVVKKKLLHVIRGTTSNIFKIDSSFTSGTYKFKTYTNWMLNFSQQNYHVQTIKILDPEKQKTIQKEIAAKNIDAQFLPEGGHILDDVINTIGVIVKDEKGYGVADLKGNLIDENNSIITTFNLNKMGIGRFSLLAKSNKNYKIEIPFNNEIKTFYFKDKIERKGVNLKLTEINNEIIISLITNTKTLKQLQNKTYTLVSQNGEKIKTIPLIFKDSKVISSRIKTNNLPTGINIFTLLNENNQPVSERIFFNYFGLNIKENATTIASKKGDSITLKLNYKNLIPASFNNVSVSILPSNTKSYSKNTNLISQSLIKPYIKGVIENGSYYFNNINKKKKFDLDNLLITQGWSSYNWNEIFKYEKDSYSYNFEQGISLKANTTDKEGSLYLLHGLRNKSGEYVTLEEGENSFKSLNFFPVEEETLNISKVNSSGKLKEPSLYVQFFPTKIAALNKNEVILNKKQESYSLEDITNNKITYSSISNVQTLAPIVIKANLEKIRMEKIRNTAMGARVVFLDNTLYDNITLATFLSTRGVRATDNQANATLDVSFVAASFNANPPLFYLNDMPIYDSAYFYQYTMEIVDYVIINRDGIGEGIRGSGGAIKIYTDPFKDKGRTNTKSIKKLNFPLTFSNSKKFYVPTYSDYSNSFFKQFGVIDWLPTNSIDENGDVSLTFKNKHNNSIKLFIEGITSEGEFIFEEKTITLD